MNQTSAMPGVPATGLHVAVVTAFPPGLQSLNEYGFHLVKGFAAHPGVSRVTVIADRLSVPLPELDLGPKVHVLRSWGFNELLTVRNILRDLRAAQPDGVVFNLQSASFGDREIPAGLGLLTPMLSRMFVGTTGVIAHNLISRVDLNHTILKGRALRQRIVSMGGQAVTRALLGASYVTVTLRNMYSHLHHNWPDAEVHLIPHGSFEVLDKEPTAYEQRGELIVTMGKFGTYKRLETLLEAFDRLRRNPANAGLKLMIAGTDHPNTPGYLSGLADQRRDDLGVSFCGYLAEDDIAGFFDAARLCVFDYSTTTGSSGVLHQAACYGAVPVFPRIGDFVDLVADEGLTGANYESGNAESMAAAIQHMLDHPDDAAATARTNLSSARGTPFSRIIDFHVERLAAGKESRPLPGWALS